MCQIRPLLAFAFPALLSPERLPDRHMHVEGGVAGAFVQFIFQIIQHIPRSVDWSHRHFVQFAQFKAHQQNISNGICSVGLRCHLCGDGEQCACAANGGNRRPS